MIDKPGSLKPRLPATLEDQVGKCIVKAIGAGTFAFTSMSGLVYLECCHDDYAAISTGGFCHHLR